MKRGLEWTTEIGTPTSCDLIYNLMGGESMKDSEPTEVPSLGDMACSLSPA